MTPRIEALVAELTAAKANETSLPTTIAEARKVAPASFAIADAAIAIARAGGSEASLYLSVGSAWVSLQIPSDVIDEAGFTLRPGEIDGVRSLAHLEQRLAHIFARRIDDIPLHGLDSPEAKLVIDAARTLKAQQEAEVAAEAAFESSTSAALRDAQQTFDALRQDGFQLYRTPDFAIETQKKKLDGEDYLAVWAAPAAIWPLALIKPCLDGTAIIYGFDYRTRKIGPEMSQRDLTLALIAEQVKSGLVAAYELAQDKTRIAALPADLRTALTPAIRRTQRRIKSIANGEREKSVFASLRPALDTVAQRLTDAKVCEIDIVDARLDKMGGIGSWTEPVVPAHAACRLDRCLFSLYYNGRRDRFEIIDSCPMANAGHRDFTIHAEIEAARPEVAIEALLDHIKAEQAAQAAIGY